MFGEQFNIINNEVYMQFLVNKIELRFHNPGKRIEGFFTFPKITNIMICFSAEDSCLYQSWFVRTLVMNALLKHNALNARKTTITHFFALIGTLNYFVNFIWLLLVYISYKTHLNIPSFTNKTHLNARKSLIALHVLFPKD